MSRSLSLAVAALTTMLALAIGGYHYATSDLLARHLCDAQELPIWAWDATAKTLHWIDRTGARVRFAHDGAERARFLISRANTICADWRDEIPYFEDALAAAESIEPPDPRLLLEAIEGLAVKLTFVDPQSKRAPRTADLWRRAITIRTQSFPAEREDLVSRKYLLAYVLAYECFSQSDTQIMQEAGVVLDDVIASDEWHVDAWELRGDIAALVKQWPEAEHFYRQSYDRRTARKDVYVQAYPPWADTAEKLAIVFGVQGRKPEADAISQEAAQLRGKHPPLSVDRRCAWVPLGPGDISPFNKLWPF